MFSTLICLLPVVIPLTRSAAISLRSCGPGGVLNLDQWELQLPTGSEGDPDTIASSSLQGCNGFTDQYFYSSGKSVVMTVPGSPESSGCVTTENSEHCRTELREVNPDGSPANWSPSASLNKLSATVQVTEADDSEYGTVIGQVHIDDDVSSKPVCELYYNSNGDIHMGVEQTRSGGDEKLTYIANVPLNYIFRYVVDYSNSQLKVTINNTTRSLSTYDLDSPASYFKAGNYNQGDSPSTVHFYSISIEH